MSPAQVEAVVGAVREGLLSIPEVLGFSEAQAGVLRRCGRALLERGAPQAAREIYGLLVRAQPYVAEHWRGHGEALQAEEEYLGAIRAYTAALAMDPEDGRTRAARGECCLLIGLLPRGLSDLQAASLGAGPWAARARDLLALHGMEVRDEADERGNEELP